jgi:putative spermidine/putrescine transport system substrate-binding protein
MHRAALAMLAALAAAVLAAGCATQPPSADDTADIDAAARQARTFHTIATSDEWANYGAQFTTFCQRTFGFDCNRDDRDRAPGASSAEEIQIWLAERNQPQSVLADIGILFIPQAEEAGILADYQPPSAATLPDDLHGPGWVTTFVGAPTILANVDALDARDLPAPESWADLADPRYAGLVGLSRVGVSGSGTWSFVAMNLAAGGTLDDWQPGVDYGRRLLPNIAQSASLEDFERGETPIAVSYDFDHAEWIEVLKQRGVRYSHVVPADGSVYAPSTLMLNGFDTAHHDFGKLFMEWVLSDEGQALFAPYGARPIRSVVGDERLEVPAEQRMNWLPDADYERVRTVDWRRIDSTMLRQIWEDQVVGPG